MQWAEPITRRAAWATIAAITVAFLSVASHVVIPIALAIMLAFAMKPVARRVEKITHSRIASVALTAIVSFGFIVSAGAVAGYQLVDFASNLETYRKTISDKIISIQTGGSDFFARASSTLTGIQHDIANATTQPAQPQAGVAIPVSVVSAAPQPGEDWLAGISAAGGAVGPFVQPVALAGVVCLLSVMLLWYGEDLRDRLIVFAGANQISVTTSALEDASKRIGRYMLMQALINTGFAIAISVGLYAVGIPNAILLGLIAGVLRFIPIIGAWLGLALPALIATAVFDTWTPVLLVVLLFACCELFVNFIIEPWLYGHSTGISGIGVIVCILFWTWLWGAAGLLLAVPMTVCLVVLGKVLEPLRVFYIFLSDEPVLDDARRLYHRVMTGDYTAAETLLQDSRTKLGIARACDQLVLPILRHARHDTERGVMTNERYDAVVGAMDSLNTDAVRELAEAPREDAPPTPQTDFSCVLISFNTADSIAARSVGHAVHSEIGMRVEWVEEALTQDLVTRLNEATTQAGQVYVLIGTTIEAAGRARVVAKLLKRAVPAARLLIGDFSSERSASASGIPATGLTEVCSSVAQLIERLTCTQREVAIITQ